MVKRTTLIEAIEEDFEQRLPGFHKSRREGLTTLAGVMLETRSANLMELAAALPREIGAADHRYQYIERQLKNEAIDADAVIKPYALQAIELLAARGQTIVLQMDQSHINDANEVLMVSARFRKRAVPVAWRVRSTQGNIGFAVQKELLDSVRYPSDAHRRLLGMSRAAPLMRRRRRGRFGRRLLASFPTPGQEFGDLFSRVIGQFREHMGEPSLRINVVEFAGFDQRKDVGGPSRAFVRARERPIAPAHGHAT